jgi:hypothetical protein
MFGQMYILCSTLLFECITNEQKAKLMYLEKPK